MFQLTKDLRLPQFVCDSCIIRLDETYAFIRLCRESEEMFTKLFPQPEQHKNPIQSSNTQLTNVNQAFHHPNNPIVVKLESEQGMLSDPLEYSNTFDILPAVENDLRKNNKDWISEARTHRERQRLSTAKRRAKMTVEQRERERERARVRQAKRRASRSDEEIRVQRERDRIRQAMKRAKFREVEMLQQQHQQLEHPLNQDSIAFKGLSLVQK